MSVQMYIDNITKDLTLTESKNLQLSTDPAEFTSIKIENRLNHFVDEWFLNPDRGLPYYRDIFKKNPDLNLVKNIIYQEIKKIETIKEINTLTVSLDYATRIATVNFQVTLYSNETVNGSLTI